MKDNALALVNGLVDPAQKLNVLREYLQASILRSLHESEAFTHLAFVGGTALRFLYNLPRFSEDLDFSVEQPAGNLPSQWLAKLKRDLTLAGFAVSVTWNDRKTVRVGWIRVSEILQEAGLAGLKQQKLSVKLKLDSRPPAGAGYRTEIINRHMIFSVRGHDLPSLMAGKIHALLTRRYPKGRDWYDLLWYRAKRPPVEPNLVLLGNALAQTGGPGTRKAQDWRLAVSRKLAVLDDTVLREDLAPFLERREEVGLVTREALNSLLAG